MRLAFNTLGCPDWSLERVVEAARAYGYDGVELRLLDGEVISPGLLREHRARLSSLFGPGRVELVALAHATRLSAGEPEERLAAVASTEQMVELAADLSTPLVRVFGGRRPDGVDLDRGIVNVAAGLNRIAPSAERHGVVVMLETHDDFRASDAVARIMARVPSRAIAVHWDVQNTVALGEEPADSLAAIGDRLVHVHVKDARRAPGDWPRLPIGEGDVPIRAALSLLHRRGYAGYLGVEIEKKWHPEYPEPEAILPQCAAALRRYLAEIEAGGDSDHQRAES